MTSTSANAQERTGPLLGCWIQLFDPTIGEIMGRCGYDLLMLDMEHGLGTVRDAASVMRAASGTGAASYVRLPSNDPVIIKTLMDQGVDGIMVPMVESKEAAQSIVAACRYPPKGVRGLAVGIARGSSYGMDATYLNTVDRRTMIACQIETLEGVRRAHEIASVDGVGMLFVGRNDLAADSGHILDLDHPEVNALVDEVMGAARAAGKKVGTVPSTGRTWQTLIAEGFDLVIPSSDISILRSFGQQEVGEFRSVTDRCDTPASFRVSRGY